ncbi:MAG: ribonuclease R [Anaerostipes sp.]|nr:ribonuclease R [Anaerostipes sp.]
MDREEKEYKERKKKITNLIYDPQYQPLKQKELGYLLGVAPEERKEFVHLLKDLIKEGKIQVTKRGKYKKMEIETKTGVFTCNQRGFGFVSVEGEEGDYFIGERDMKDAFQSDTVLIEVTVADPKPGKRKEARVIKVLERGITHMVGTFQQNKSFGFVTPDNQKFDSDIFIAKKNCGNLTTGFKVVVEILSYGDENHSPEGKVTEVLGHKDDPRVDILSIVKAYNIPTEFDESVIHQVGQVPGEVDTSKFMNRKDIRTWDTVTIDGEDAKDLDDAITLTKNEKGYRLGVHIADVSEYVTENSPLDKEAKKRGTSVYLVDRVIPMLPHQLSNGICSLNAGCDRLALSCIMDIDFNGKVTDHEIAETLINVNERMSYTDVSAVLKEEEEQCKRYKPLVPMFHLMAELSEIIRRSRHKRGSIDFDFPESKILLDEDGRPTDVFPSMRNAATKIIEDFMLMANETIAEEYYWQEIPFVYRNHENPDTEKINQLRAFLENFGIYLKSTKDEIHPKEVQKLLEKVEGTPEEPLISRLTLRSMKQARYTTESAGHFGLSTKYYCHFTSPIRRYPDLQIHRIIKENLRGNLNKKRIHHYEETLSKVALDSSKTERRAEEVEREVEKLKKAQYMERHIGEEYEGVISSVTAWGVYIELPNTIEGMIHVSKLPGDYYFYDEHTYSMVGERTNRTFKLGQKVKIRVKEVDILLKNIDFELVEEDEEPNE